MTNTAELVSRVSTVLQHAERLSSISTADLESAKEHLGRVARRSDDVIVLNYKCSEAIDLGTITMHFANQMLVDVCVLHLSRALGSARARRAHTDALAVLDDVATQLEAFIGELF